jgi:hypothetical protein
VQGAKPPDGVRGVPEYINHYLLAAAGGESKSAENIRYETIALNLEK